MRAMKHCIKCGALIGPGEDEGEIFVCAKGKGCKEREGVVKAKKPVVEVIRDFFKK